MASRLLFIFLVLFFAWAGHAQTERALFAPVPLAPTPLAAGALMLSEDSARRALALGLTATAAAQAEQLVARSAEGSAARDAAALLLAAARLELNDAQGAALALANHGPERPAAYRLRAGLIAARKRQLAAAQAELAGMRVEALPLEERSWFYFLQGMVAELVRDAPRATAAYEQALGAATSGWQRARIQLARERVRLGQGEATETQAAALRDQAERYAGRSVGTDYAIQHAVALSLLGRRDQATSYLQAHLATLAGEGAAESRDDTRLMLGLIAGPGQGTGRAALEQLLTNGRDRGKQRMALVLLGEGAESIEAREQLRRTAGRLLEATPAHPLTEELLLARAELALVDRFYAESEAGARELLARFPGSELRARALTQLASTTWELKRFRTAADYAVQAAGATGDAAAASALRLLAAEAWYRAAEEASKDGGAAGAADYTAAGEAYAALAAEPPPGVPAASVLFQRVMSELGAGRTARAAELIDQFALDDRFDATTRWQAEWNLARVLQAAGQSELARARIARLRAESGVVERPVGLRARLVWLEARLAQESARPEEALVLSRAIPESLAGVEPALAREISGLGRLVEAEALFGIGRSDEAVAVLKSLRSAEPGTEAALQSFLVEAAYQAMEGRLVEAQGLLTSFADEHRDHEYAPYAIFQAALNAERRGEDAYYREAYLLLERLVADYGQNDLVFTARMRQGDLLRKLNQFPQAQLTYELLINQYAQHPDVLLAEMALADCHRAQAARDASRFESAITLLERLRDLASAPVDLRAEAGFKLGDMLATREPRDERSANAALAVWGPLLDALVAEPQATVALGSRGRYWVGRTAVRMAAVLEQMGRVDEAMDVYRLIVERGLPGVTIAAARLETGAVSSPR
jgi:hypothetical protein